MRTPGLAAWRRSVRSQKLGSSGVTGAGGQGWPVGPQRPCGSVGGEHVRAPAGDIGRAGVQAVDERADRGSKRFGPVEVLGARSPWTSSCRWVRSGGAEPQRAGQRVEDQSGRPHVAALLKERVVGRRDRGEHRDLLATQAGRAAPGARGEPDIGGSQALAALGWMGMSQAYGPTDDTELIATVQRAIDLGITFLDTAMSYGAGHNERLLGRALAGRRDQVTLATKLGIDVDGVRVAARPEHVRGYCEASLPRLGVDHIDLYYLHRVDPSVAIEETIGAIALNSGSDKRATSPRR